MTTINEDSAQSPPHESAEQLHLALFTSSTKERITKLQSLRDRLFSKELSHEQQHEAVNLLTSTYAFYVDRSSRISVRRCLIALISADNRDQHLATLCRFLGLEASKASLAPGSLFVLVEWSSTLLQEIGKHPGLWKNAGIELTTSLARLLEKCLASTDRSSLKETALVKARAGLRAVFKSEPIRETAIKEAVSTLTKKSPNPSNTNAPLLGVVAGVCERLPSVRGFLKAHVTDFLTFYSREILGTRATLPKHIANGLHDFFQSSVIDGAALEQNVFPAMEKALLRAPEVVLNDLVTPLVHSLRNDIDLSSPLQKNLLKPLLSNAKSTNAQIRDGAVRAFQVIASHSKQEDILRQVQNELLKVLKDTKVADQRALYASMVSSLTPSDVLCKESTMTVASLAPKEANENALNSETIALRVDVIQALKNDTPVDPSAIKAFQQGLGDKKPTIRRIWALRFGEIIYALSPDAIQSSAAEQFVEHLVDKLKGTWDEVTGNVVTSATNGLIVAAYIILFTIVTRLHKTKSLKLSTFAKSVGGTSCGAGTEEKVSFLLNGRAYTKLVAHDDCLWFLRSLSATSTSLTNDSHNGRGWAQAMIYMVVALNTPPSIRLEAAHSLTEAYLGNPERIAHILIEELWNFCRGVDLEEKDSVAVATKTGKTELWRIVGALCVSPHLAIKRGKALDPELVQLQLVKLVVLCRLPLLPRVKWLDLRLVTGIDPSTLVTKHAQTALDEVSKHATDSSNPFSENVFKAACDAAAELTFVAPEIVTPLLVDLITSDLDSAQLKDIGPAEVAIYRTPPGTTFVDVLNQKVQNQLPDKKAKDYDILKWEAELRSQLVKKQGQQKLTADEQVKVKAQLVKEADIRKHVSGVYAKLHRSIGIIASLARLPKGDTESADSEAWIGPVIDSLIKAIGEGAGRVIGNAAAIAFLSCADRISSRLGPLRKFIGVSILRAEGTSQLSEELEAEPLGDLITRVLYRLRFSGEQRPFDVVSIIYILPLIKFVLEQAGVGKPAGDESDEQITLALEFLNFHTHQFSDPQLPRGEVCALLISSMQRYTQHYRLIKDCILGVSHSIAPDITPAELEVFLHGSILPEASVRSCALQAIDTEFELANGEFCPEIWLASHDEDTENAEVALTIWEENEQQLNINSLMQLVPYLESLDHSLRGATARALADCSKQYPENLEDLLRSLEALYIEKAKSKQPERDAYGMLKKTDLRDPWEARHGIALAFKELAAQYKADSIVPHIQFLVERGPLADKSPQVRDKMLDAASYLINIQGGLRVEELMKIFEATLEAPERNSEEHDLVNEAAIIMYGALARHLKPGDKRIPVVVNRLLTTLSTPSENVQYAISGCLPPLVQSSASEIPKYLEYIMDQLLKSKKYATQRGAAYGLAGIVQGKGLSALREFRILSSLKGAVEDKKDQNQRKGAFMAYELLSAILGPIFEPYVIQIVPQLLTGFGDSSTDVREACLDAAKTCFASLSSFGVKQILPILLDGLDEQQWRSKKGACDSLGAMAYLDPQQLAASLPEIIPPLTNVLNDSHKEVRGSANRSLQRFGDVISNPEIKSVVNILLKALSDPTKYTDEALDSLLKVSFIHYLDAPSLALVVRILERGLNDRSATKRKSSQIIGSLAHLTERRDLVAHLPILVLGLRVAAVDPVPATRATASKALGSLVEKLGEETLPDLIPSLMSTLKTDTGAGDRLGSAQALSEVLAGLGTARLEDTLPSILQNVSSNKAAVREGFMSLFIYLPACFGNSFANYLSRIIPPILSGLADEVESIRETSLRAGRLLVKNFATRAIDLLLPELQRGLADDSHRIRLSSVELVGDLLFNLTGISGKSEEDQEAEENATAAGQSLLQVLGEEKRNNILSALYISRCDTSGLVRTAAINVWKALVATPRTLREITPTLTHAIIRRLGSSNMEQKVIAGNALGELIRKAGDNVLASLLPTLEEGLQTSIDSDAKQGICIAMRELITSASPDSLADYEPKLISVVRTALVDPSPEVRDAAAEAFDSLQRMFGKKVVDQILPNLLGQLRNEDEAENALAALLTLLEEHTRSNVILPNLLPTLLAPPISAFNARAVSSLASVAGSSMTRRLSNILNALLDNIITCKEEVRLEALNAAFDAVLLSVDETDGLSSAMTAMLGFAKNDDHRKRACADTHLVTFFTQAEVDYSRYYPDLIRALLISFDDSDPAVVKAAWSALSTLTSKLRKEDMESLVISTRQILSQVGVPGHNLPGFLLPKGINAILPIFLQGLINGSPEQRTQSALAISEIIDKTSGDALKPFVTQITGPLIRVVSERSVEVKTSILLTLNNLLEKIPNFLKPFLPQLQRTFTKALADPSSEILRTRASKALGTLITMTPRIDPLIGELVTGSKTSDEGVKTAMQKALYEVISKVGASMSDASRTAILGLIDEDASESNDSMGIANARLLGALTKNLTEDTAGALIKTRVLPSHLNKAAALAINAILLESSSTLMGSFHTETVATICRGLAEPHISEDYVLAAGKYLLIESKNKSFESTKPIFEAFIPILQLGAPIDPRRLTLVVLRTVCRENPDLVRPHLPTLAPAIFPNVRDPVIPIKLSAEAAFLALFCVVDEEDHIFEKYINGAGASLPANTKRVMQDYFKRVAIRLGAQARERREAEGGHGGLGLSNDEKDDEKEVWSVGKVDLGEATFDE